MSRILELRVKAKAVKRRVVLPEGNDDRVVRAASFIAKESLADVCLLGNKEDVKKLAAKNSISLEGVNVLDPLIHEKRGEIVNSYYELRKAKGMTLEEADKFLNEKTVFYAAMMVKLGMADGFVGGASCATADVARAAIHCIRLDKEIGTLSSCFVMEINDCPYGDKGLFVYADCGVIPYPSPRQLAGIAIASSDLFARLFGVKPRVAMLSYSTKGSASGETIDGINDAVAKVKERRPDILIEGELQVDAALVPEVARKKCGESEVAGKANVLIFPNLDAGNIAYKLTERLARAKAIGPILQGLESPCSDLSRGCSWEDVVDAVVITAVRVVK